jgi:hypothetical protein
LGVVGDSAAGDVPLAVTGVVAVTPLLAAAVAPVISNFCFDPIVCRAARVAKVLATAFALVSTVFVTDFRGFKPKTARVSGDCENIPWTIWRSPDSNVAD